MLICVRVGLRASNAGSIPAASIATWHRKDKPERQWLILRCHLLVFSVWGGVKGKPTVPHKGKVRSSEVELGPNRSAEAGSIPAAPME